MRPVLIVYLHRALRVLFVLVIRMSVEPLDRPRLEFSEESSPSKTFTFGHVENEAKRGCQAEIGSHRRNEREVHEPLEMNDKKTSHQGSIISGAKENVLLPSNLRPRAKPIY